MSIRNLHHPPPRWATIFGPDNLALEPRLACQAETVKSPKPVKLKFVLTDGDTVVRFVYSCRPTAKFVSPMLTSYALLQVRRQITYQTILIRGLPTYADRRALGSDRSRSRPPCSALVSCSALRASDCFARIKKRKADREKLVTSF